MRKCRLAAGAKRRIYCGIKSRAKGRKKRANGDSAHRTKQGSI